MEITLELPTKAYLKKYVEKSSASVEMKLTERWWFGVLVLNVLKRKTFKNPNYDYKQHNQKYDDSLTLIMHLDKSVRYGCILLAPQVFYINRSLDQIFKAEIIKMALVNQSAYEIDFKTSILNILDAYDITEDELSYQTIRKEFNRKYKLYSNKLIV